MFRTNAYHFNDVYPGGSPKRSWNDPETIREMNDFLLKSVCSAYGIPPHLLGPQEKFAPADVQERWHEYLHLMLDRKHICRGKLIDDAPHRD